MLFVRKTIFQQGTMKIEITGDPGTGNTFSETHIDYVENYNPNAQTVVNYNYGTSAKKVCDQGQANDNADTAPIRQEIFSYVSRLKPCLNNNWKQCYDKLWSDILSIPEVAEKIYNPGKQQNTNFNRNLVANIIHYLGIQGAFGEYNAAQFTEALEGDKDHSVRRALGADPEKGIEAKIKNLLQRHSPSSTSQEDDIN